MSKQPKYSISSGGQQKKSAKLSDQGRSQTPINANEGIDTKKNAKKSILENQILAPSQSAISRSSSGAEDNYQIEVKEKGFKNYFEQYYDKKSGDTIFKEYYKPDILAKELKKNKLKISDLTITKYNSSIIQREDDKNGYSYFNDNMNNSEFLKSLGVMKVNFGPIFSLPRIKVQEIEKNVQPIQNKNSNTKQKLEQDKIGSGFVSFERIKDMNGILLSSMEQEFQEKSKSQHPNSCSLIKDSKDLFLNKSNNNQSGYINTKSFMEKSFNQIGDKNYIKNSYYSNKEKLKYTLQHNKFHENQLKEFDQKEQLKSLCRLQNIIENQQKIMMKQQYRKYPSSLPNLHNKFPSDLEQLSSKQNLESQTVIEKSTENLEKSPQTNRIDKLTTMNSTLRSQKSLITQRACIASPDLQKPSLFKSNQKNSQSPKQKNRDKQKNLINFHPCFILKDEENTWKPEVRELFKIAYNGAFIYMFGGCSSKPMSDMCVFDIQQNKWSLVNTQQLEDGRYNHMMGMYKKNIIIFGGEKLEGQYEQKSKVCQNDTRIYNLEKNEWKYMRPTGDIIEPRRNSASCIVGRYLIIQGGINQKGIFLNDLWILDIANHRWSSGQHEDRHNFMAEGRAFHRACPVFHPDKKQIDLFKDQSEKMTEKQIAEIKYEGVYFFGGQNQQGEANNQLSILITHTRPMYFIQPETTGKKPDCRYNHSVTYNSRLKYLVVYGGRNENLQSEQTFFDDLFILQLSDLQWFECATVGLELQKRANHEAVCFDSQLLIFGGIGENGFYSFEVLKIELDKTKARRCIIDQQMKEKQEEIQTLKRSKTIKGNVNTTSQKRKEKVKQHENFIKSLQQEQDGIKNLVEKLNFKNYKSFLPIPVIFKRKRSNSKIYNKKEEQQKKDELDQEVNHHVDADRKINEQIINASSNSPSPRGSMGTPRSARNQLNHSQTVSFVDQRQIMVLKPIVETPRNSTFKISSQGDIPLPLQIPK